MSCKSDRKLCDHKKMPISKHCLVPSCGNYYGPCSDHQLAVGGRR